MLATTEKTTLLDSLQEETERSGNNWLPGACYIDGNSCYLAVSNSSLRDFCNRWFNVPTPADRWFNVSTPDNSTNGYQPFIYALSGPSWVTVAGIVLCVLLLGVIIYVILRAILAQK